MKPTSFRLTQIDGQSLPTDLRLERVAILDRGEPCEIAGIVFLDEEERELPERGAVLYAPAAGRAGIAWGADADWTDADSLEDGVRRYLGSGDWSN